MSVEQEYHFALWETEQTGIDKKLWLKGYFELYKTTLIYPPGLPPIPTCNLKQGEIRTVFHKAYRKILSEFDYELDNDTRTLKFN